MAEGKTSVVCFSLSNIYTQSAKTCPKCNINYLHLRGDPIKQKLMLIDNNTDTEETLNLGGHKIFCPDV